ncbi:hypothetical protein JOC26_002345 [Sporohalobacter salinus]|nr:hypothetical protein [Sporohalobacter salinus]
MRLESWLNVNPPWLKARGGVIGDRRVDTELINTSHARGVWLNCQVQQKNKSGI